MRIVIIKILGIDPGSRKAGFGVIELGKNNKIHYIYSETVFFDTKKDFLDRVPEFFSHTKRIVEKFDPSEIALESLIYVKSPTALIKLGQARGAMLSALFECGKGSNIYEYSPNLIKSQTTGHGHSDKLTGQKFVNTILGKRDYKTDDESDALLVALCHAFHHNKPVRHKKTRKGSLADSLSHKI